MRAWLALTGALALHVADEASTGFLSFYNPLVLQIRGRFAWFPMPTFTFGIWLSGLVLLVVILAMLAPVVRRSAGVARPLAWILSVIMIANGAAHLAGSGYFQRWLPGTTSAPLLLAAGAYLIQVTRSRT